MPRQKQKLMERKAPVEFTPELKQKYLEHLRETGFQTLSAEAVGVTTRTVQDHKASDLAFAEAYQQAIDHHTENVIERAMVHRATVGVRKPIIGGKDRDRVVTHVQEFSDACLLALARARKFEYNKGAGGEGDGPGGGGPGNGRVGGVLIVPAAPHTIDSWESLYGEKAKGLTGQPEGAQ